MVSTPQEFAEFLAAQIRKWPDVIKAANVQPQ
jgi:tripartite-type tricarboxylate transporter receptor subunit TctC